RSLIRFSPCCPAAAVEMPQWLLATIISTGSGFSGRELHTRQVGKSPSAVPASPPWTTVIPLAPARLLAMAVPGAMENCTSMGEAGVHEGSLWVLLRASL